MSAVVTKEQVFSFIENMSVLELSQFVKDLELKFGVSAATPVAVVAAPGAAVAPVAEAKTEFNVILSVVGEKKINVIKEIRAITGLGLKEAKELVEGAPKLVKEAVSKQEAEEIKKKLETEGAKVEIQ
jgi:large subunit ribosomal protein L7/L12